jgi:hypothetical protein
MKRLLRALALIALGLPSLALADLRGVSTLPFQINQATLVNGQTICYVAASLNWQNCTPSGGGNVSTSGSPVAAQLAIFSGSTGITGYSGLTYNSGTGVLSVPSVTASGTMTATQFALGSTGWSGILNAPIIQNATFTGTQTNAAAAFGMFLQQTDNSSCVTSAFCSGIYENMVIGTNSVGTRLAAGLNLNINAVTANTSPTTYVGLGISCNIRITDTFPGDCYGANPIANLASGSTARRLVGAEVDVAESSGATISDYRAGFNVVDISSSNNDAQGTNADFGIGLNFANFNPNTSGHGFKYGQVMGNAESYFPVSSTGTMFWACNNSTATSTCAYTVAKGWDLSNGTFTSFSFYDGITKLGPNGILTANLNGTSAGSAIAIGTNNGTTYTGISVNPSSAAVTVAASAPSGSADLHLASASGGNVYLQNGSGALALLASSGGASFSSGDYVIIDGVANGNQFAQVAVGGSDSQVDLYLKGKGTNGAIVVIPASDGQSFILKNAALTTTYMLMNTSTPLLTFGSTPVSINASSNFNTSINTGTSTGTITIGNPGTTGVTILAGLAATSAAQTGTVCLGIGNVLSYDTTTTCLLSDGTLKMNVEPLEHALAEVMQLKPVSYDLKPEVNPTHLGRQVGLVAQDVIQVDPRLASVYQSGPNEGSPSGVRYEQAVALLVSAIQEQQAEIERLRRVN